MTDHNRIVFGGMPLHLRLGSQLPELTAFVIKRLVDGLDVYNRLPAEELSGDVARIIEQAIRLFLGVLRTGTLPDSAELAIVRESAARRAEEGLPIDAVIGAYHLGAQACFEFVEPEVQPDELGSVFEAHRLLFNYLRLTTGAVAAGYLSERQSMFGDEHGARQALLATLLDGGRSADVAGTRLPPSYFVVSLSIGKHPDETIAGVDPGVAGRRKLRRLRTELDRRSREPVLSMLSADGGLALIPHHTAPASVSLEDWSRLEALAAALSKAAGAPVVAGVVATEPAGVPDAARLAGEVREVAMIYAKPPGIYRLADLLLEYQLTRPSPARDHLASLLAPVAGKPDLLPTLRVFLDTGLNRRQTATQLRVHPNTVDYRLRKIAGLTGLQVARHEDLLSIRAALSALDATKVHG
ncbi:PucR C-terminal helix-turn-helix domain-containing protein [Actinokineospora alba]|uniref:PucR C-terminal helix-turn-helix domain-containing protein n=1 Tax=Actinokineospora alba TaxID=504798 RepID=A0A1H0PYJ3_9PSEU|nr:PucR family transcriptional regulator [Actinokineospora alba]TDP65976.1 PucR-like helix-turn-helix protein [Actinokineospora alba]SDI61022.1 PucR C-terminal helix-turn-helix domain-containing protein [Actinokineospora alba]SDP09499.1 PucR C-terminal helix-turn-helix domain-containing protein [Actinokineospora alba]